VLSPILMPREIEDSSTKKSQIPYYIDGNVMLRSIRQFYGDKLRASDGEIGLVKDFYFDDQNWTIRYLVADTGSWLPGRQGLLSPHSLGRPGESGEGLGVNLIR